MAALNIRGLTKSYEDRVILKNLNLKVQPGEIVIITGKSGSGKTTLLLSILGFIKPDQGEIVINDKDISFESIEQRQMAYVPQDYGLFPHLTVKENIAFGLKLRNVEETEQHKKIQELFKTVKLSEDFSNRNVAELSGGEKQKVALARALAITPQLFLFDEPLSGIDPETKHFVGKQLRSMIKKLTLPAIIISHDIREAHTLGDTIYTLEKGILRKIKSK